MKQALEALEWNLPVIEDYGDKEQLNRQHKAITSLYDALRQAIEQAEKQEPAAWIHTKIEGVTVPHRPADLDKHPDRWESLYKTPPPCPTCEALARTVMMDQTAHDLYTNPQPQREWIGLTDEEIEIVSGDYTESEGFKHGARWALDQLKEKNQ
jgi:hypothetical protein